MPKLSQDVYDVVIIGAGIGGLVCGCYLAKAGMKVLIVEQHHKPGGYCTSFTRKGFTFDAAAHSLGGLCNGILGRILRDLEIYEKLNIRRFDISNTIVAPDCEISFWSDLEKTIDDFERIFPDEKKMIRDFFYSLATFNLNDFLNVRKLTFQEYLNLYFRNKELISIITFPVLGNVGTAPSLISAHIGISMFKEYILEGGYYLLGGIQKLAETLSEVFQSSGGELQLSCKVTKVLISHGASAGVVIKDDKSVKATYVVSNCDARQTYLSLVGECYLPSEFKICLQTYTPSLSMFILYLGVNNENYLQTHRCGNIWLMKGYDLERYFLSIFKEDHHFNDSYLLHISNDRKTVTALSLAPFRNKGYWQSNKLRLENMFTEQIERDILSKLKENIIVKDSATPSTLHRYTLNSEGAAFGWASIPSQFAITDFRKPSFIKQFYLAGHWSTQGVGIPGVAYSGYDTAKMILRREKILLNNPHKIRAAHG